MDDRRYVLGGMAVAVVLGLVWVLTGTRNCSEAPSEGTETAARTSEDAGAGDEERSPEEQHADARATVAGGGSASGDAEDSPPEPGEGSAELGDASEGESDESKNRVHAAGGESAAGADAASATGDESQTSERDAGASRTAQSDDPSSDATPGAGDERSAVELADIAPDEMGPRDVARRVQKYYDHTKDFRAQFTQVYTDMAAGETKTRYGKIYLKKPGKMRWDYYDGAQLQNRKKTLVSDGSVLWVYEMEFEQVFKKCLGASQLPTSLTFLMGRGDLLQEFKVSFAEDAPSGTWLLELKPRTPTSKYSKLQLRVDRESHRVDKTVVFDPYGNTNAVEFRQARRNPGLPASGFSFTPPDDARVLNRDKSCN